MLKRHDIEAVLLRFIDRYPQLTWSFNEATIGGVLDLEAINAVLHINNGVKVYLSINTFTYCKIDIVGDNIDIPFMYPIWDKEVLAEYFNYMFEKYSEFDQFCEDTLPF